MILISNCGNTAGRVEQRENSPEYIEQAIAQGYDVKVDAWLIDRQWMLGRDFPIYNISKEFLERPAVWTRAMNLVAYVSLYHNTRAHVFWLNRDEFTFTSRGIKWAAPGIVTRDGVMWLNETDHPSVQSIQGIDPLGVCSDHCAQFRT